MLHMLPLHTLLCQSSPGLTALVTLCVGIVDCEVCTSTQRTAALLVLLVISPDWHDLWCEDGCSGSHGVPLLLVAVYTLDGVDDSEPVGATAEACVGVATACAYFKARLLPTDNLMQIGGELANAKVDGLRRWTPLVHITGRRISRGHLIIPELLQSRHDLSA